MDQRQAVPCMTEGRVLIAKCTQVERTGVAVCDNL